MKFMLLESLKAYTWLVVVFDRGNLSCQVVFFWEEVLGTKSSDLFVGYQ